MMHKAYVCKCRHWESQHSVEGDCHKCSCEAYETDFVRSTELLEEAVQRHYDEWKDQQ